MIQMKRDMKHFKAIKGISVLSTIATQNIRPQVQAIKHAHLRRGLLIIQHL